MSLGLGLILVAAQALAAPEVRVDDAFVTTASDGESWAIGSAGMQMTYAVHDGLFQLRGIQNGLSSPLQNFEPMCAPFGVETLANSGHFSFELLNEVVLEPGGSVEPALLSTGELLQISVKQGQLIGFGAATYDDRNGAGLEWATTLDYGDGEHYSSTEDTALDQGPIWYYYMAAPGANAMELLGEVVDSPATAKARVPAGFRAPFECSSLAGSRISLLNAYRLIRVWKAPKDGVVSVGGTAKHTAGGTKVNLDIYRIGESTAQPSALTERYDRWTLESADARQVAVGGRPAVQLDIVLLRETLRAVMHVQAYPRSSVLRQWVDLENSGGTPLTLHSPTPLSIVMPETVASPLTNYWMCGGTSRPNQGQLESAEVTDGYHRALLGEKTDNYVPWMAFSRHTAAKDGWFVALDHLGTWTISYDYAAGQARLAICAPGLTDTTLAPGGTLHMPLVTLGTFVGDLDDMGRRAYDWQYEYLWDYTNSDYFARTKWAVPWFFSSRNLQEQFAARLAGLDMNADLMRTMGMEMLWDDAGWSKYPGWPIEDSYTVVFSPTHEGPDFAETLRYLDKMDMKWLLWMAGRPSAGLLATKVGAWGNFQWRTDGFGRFGLPEEESMRAQIENFLQAHPDCSFHTCDGGSRYAHQFEIQRYADVNYLSDLGRGDQTNHYFSYLELPDKWMDLLEALMRPGSKYDPKTGPGQLSMVPGWYIQAEGVEQEQLRRLMEIYRYLRREGVAGRWSHMVHPVIKGDQEFYYDQRINYDGTKACVILKHQPAGEVTIYPSGLLPEHAYAVGYETTRALSTRSGADLMATGISLINPAPGEVIFLGMPEFPGFVQDATPPQAPGQALVYHETNIGHSGAGIYWSPGGIDTWTSYYEVRRGDTLIGKTSVGTYYFDHSTGWDGQNQYAVRAVANDGKEVSAWTPAKWQAGAPTTYAALGGHFPEAGRDGWRAETTADGHSFDAMTWVPPAKSAAGDLGGTPNQPGGVEGYWEGPGQARVGRGWQQASPEVACVRAWIAPRSGRVTVVGRAMKECYRQAMGSPLQVGILKGDQPVWPTEGWSEVPLNSLTGVMHDFSLDVTAGDCLRFVLNRGVSPDTDIIAWMPRITYASDSKGTDVVPSVVRIRCGNPEPYTDQNGNVWSGDRYYAGGIATQTSGTVKDNVSTASDQALYQSAREGSDFSYAIPVSPGRYTVLLKFAETTHRWAFERPINLQINGRRVLENFDICHDTRGPGRACEKVFNQILPGADGTIVLHFSGGFEPSQKTSDAIVQAIEILPETKPVYRIDVGNDINFIDWNSFVWSADTYFDGGDVIRSAAPVAQASPTLYDAALYQTARSGKTIRYSIPAPPGLYTVHLKFAELWLPEAGKRPMRIIVNGRVVKDAWDPAEAAGQIGMSADIRVENLATDKDGRIAIAVEALGSNDAILQGIEIE